MAQDRSVGALGVIAGTAITGSYIIPRGKGTLNAQTSNAGRGEALTHYLSGYSIRETAGSTAVVRIRDSFALPGPIASAADGAAGNSTVGLHMFVITGVTKWGESTYGRNAGDRLEFTTAGSKIVGLSGIPLFGVANTDGSRTTNADAAEIVGRRLYATKAGAPATTVTPTNAQWFLYAADASSTLASGENGKTLPEATLSVADGTNFATAGKLLVQTSDGLQVVTYTGKSTNDLTGCTGGSGTMATGGTVTQPMIPNNTATTFDFNLADANLVATAPPIRDTAGRPVDGTITLAANESTREKWGSNVVGAGNDGGFAVDIVSGAIDWVLRGQ